jgi:general secretion pathway protein L
LLLTPATDAVHVSLNRRGRVYQLGQIPIAAENESRRSLSKLLDGTSPRNLDIVVNIPADGVLRRRVALPIEAAENLREVLAFEMDRHTPFKAGEVAYDYRLIDTDAGNKRLTVDLVVVPTAIIDRAAAIAGSFGLTARRIGIVDDELQHYKPFNFRPYEATEWSTVQRPLVVALATTAVILAIIAWYLPLYFDHQASAAYQAQLEATRAEALQTEAVKKRLAAAMDLNQRLVDWRAATPTATSLLADVTDRLPDDTWLTELQLQNGELALTGYSPSAAALISRLETSPLLSDVRFGSPVTPDAQVGSERFHILAHVALDRGA